MYSTNTRATGSRGRGIDGAAQTNVHCSNNVALIGRRVTEKRRSRKSEVTSVLKEPHLTSDPWSQIHPRTSSFVTLRV